MKKQYIIPEASVVLATQTFNLMEGSDKVEGSNGVDAGYKGTDETGEKDPDAKERDFYTEGLW